VDVTTSTTSGSACDNCTSSTWLAISRAIRPRNPPTVAPSSTNLETAAFTAFNLSPETSQNRVLAVLIYLRAGEATT
jgi:hypothetical protein